MRILIIEDEKILAESIKTLLIGKGYEAEAVYDGLTGLDYARLDVYDLIILDVMMPGMNGFEVARVLRKERIGTPILMLTAKPEIDDRVHGLNSGADYYLTKPFDARELLACVNALLRRQGTQVEELCAGNTCLNLGDATLATSEESLRLSAKEFEVMRMLLAAGDQIVSKESILTKVWGYDSEAVENNVEVYVGFLRKKLKAIGSNLRIEAIRKLGYHVEVEQAGDK